jgi:hypothetical protein
VNYGANEILKSVFGGMDSHVWDAMRGRGASGLGGDAPRESPLASEPAA